MYCYVDIQVCAHPREDPHLQLVQQTHEEADKAGQQVDLCTRRQGYIKIFLEMTIILRIFAYFCWTTWA